MGDFKKDRTPLVSLKASTKSPTKSKGISWGILVGIISTSSLLGRGNITRK